MLGTPRKRGREEEEEDEEMVVSTSAFSEALEGNHPSAPRNSTSRAAFPPSQPCFFFPGNLDSDVSAMVQRDLQELDRFVSSQVINSPSPSQPTRITATATTMHHAPPRASGAVTELD